jgi:hypothetical protein
MTTGVNLVALSLDNLEENKEKIKEKENIIINLDVGGVKYKTTISTLSSVKNSYWTTLVEGIDVSKQEIYLDYVDRDGRLFKFILNYLRNKDKVVLPILELDLLELRLEADYYHLIQLSKLIDVKLEVLKKEYIKECVYCKQKLNIINNKDTLCLDTTVIRDHIGFPIFNNSSQKYVWSCCYVETAMADTCIIAKYYHNRRHLFI